MKRLFGYFEARIDPYPAQPPAQPPARFWPFLWHYAHPLAPWLIAMAGISALVAAAEIVLMGYLGTLVNRMAELGPERFLAEESARLGGMAMLLLVVLPALSVIGALIMYQTLTGISRSASAGWGIAGCWASRLGIFRMNSPVASPRG